MLGERSNQCTDNLKYKIPRRPRDFESSKKRKVQDTHKLDIIKSKSMGEEDILVCSKRTTELPFRKGLEANKCLTALKKKRILEDAILINNLEDDKVYVPSKTYSRSKARKMDDVKVIVFLNAYSLYWKVPYFIIIFLVGWALYQSLIMFTCVNRILSKLPEDVINAWKRKEQHMYLVLNVRKCIVCEASGIGIVVYI